MKILLIILFCLSTHSCFSQFYLGYTENEVRDQIEASSPHKQIKKNFILQGGFSLIWEESNWTSVVYFNNKNISDLYVLIPNDANVLNYLIERFNKDFYIVSDTYWRRYSNGKVYKIELVYSKTARQYVFSIMFFNSQKSQIDDLKY
ncbi:hypothetical protein HGH93_08620 [Chitinophaga polysaccharea]|uniref:hypothetical protein n=1 Tax=Chitinophaga polysaccharea TaxID=1293035 RepID=UPI00145598DB|nr:hypothetical protein [Chitinophaga polysaccharea]NLR58158.1 hypothetical protein [Chitinophaga polysaccharea]